MMNANRCVCCDDIIPEGNMVCRECMEANNVAIKEECNLSEEPVCNRCGRKLDVFDLQQNFIIHRKIEYGSSYDGCEVHFQLCCECFDKLVGECTINPIKEVDDE